MAIQRKVILLYGPDFSSCKVGFHLRSTTPLQWLSRWIPELPGRANLLCPSAYDRVITSRHSHLEGESLLPHALGQ
jgi:hypothetical protein